jgi:predicted AAA+ superfamily ATPase
MNREILTSFLIQELIKNGRKKEQLYYYEKVNGTIVDCIIQTNDNKLIPISILDPLSPSKSKALHYFIQQYKEKIDYAIQLCPYYSEEIISN